jgi:hypothetical protein
MRRGFSPGGDSSVMKPFRKLVYNKKGVRFTIGLRNGEGWGSCQEKISNLLI